MAETVTSGVYRSRQDLAGRTISNIRREFAKLWSISGGATAVLNGLDIAPTHESVVVVQPGDTVEFTLRQVRSRTVCSECDKPTYTEIEGYPLCHDHYTHTITHCTEHHWMLDSTEVFHEQGKPVFRAFYFCTICARAVIAKAGETADDAWINRQRERLLRIEKLLTEDV